MPSTPVTPWPFFGEMCAAPWISAIAGGGAKVVKLNTRSEAIVSGGSLASWSATWAATIVTVQDSPCAKSTSGFSVKLCGPPLAIAVCAPLVAHEIENHEPVTSTCSEKSIVMSASTGMPTAPFAGVVDETDGAASPTHGAAVVAVFRGVGVPTVKSAALSSLSAQPPPFRTAAVVLEVPPVGPEPSKKFAVPYPTRSTMRASCDASHGVEPPLQPRAV